MIEKLKAMRDLYGDERVGSLINITGDIVNKVNEIIDYTNKPTPSSLQNNWIPLANEQPEFDGYYLVSCLGGDVHVDFCLRGVWDNKFEYTLLAWMPLPKPYNKED